MKNGVAVCVPFDHPNKRPVDTGKNKLPETTSLSSDVFKPRPALHAGMLKKPLEKYHPNAHRNRLPSPTLMMPYKNSSQIVIGDRSSHYKR